MPAITRPISVVEKIALPNWLAKDVLTGLFVELAPELAPDGSGSGRSRRN